jgi:hypothetical protein
MLSHFSIEISQFVEIFEPEVSKKSWKSLDYVEKSWKFSINLDSLDKSRQSRFVSTISINISTKINLDREKKNWSRHDGYSRRFSKVSLDTKDDLNLDWSRLSRPPRLIKMFDQVNKFWNSISRLFSKNIEEA